MNPAALTVTATIGVVLASGCGGRVSSGVVESEVPPASEFDASLDVGAYGDGAPRFDAPSSVEDAGLTTEAATADGDPVAGDAPSVTACPTDAGAPTMVRLPEGYCIDSTEVTRGQYAGWLANSPPIGSVLQRCQWNDTFEPRHDCDKLVTDHQACGDNECEDLPETCVDWCDAYEYCRWVGKRLCGAIGGGHLQPWGYGDSARSPWQNACASSAGHAYPYGDDYQPTTCNGADAHKSPLTPVGAMPTCQSSTPGYEGVYGLSGNAAEWEDACAIDNQTATDGTMDLCRVRGGFSSDSSEGLACAADRTLGRVGVAGFRCCFP